MIKKRCQFCDKEVEGYTVKQVEYMLKQHILSKHQDKIIFPKNKEDKT